MQSQATNAMLVHRTSAKRRNDITASKWIEIILNDISNEEKGVKNEGWCRKKENILRTLRQKLFTIEKRAE